MQSRKFPYFHVVAKVFLIVIEIDPKKGGTFANGSVKSFA
jgi:hypothetical protein